MVITDITLAVGVHLKNPCLMLLWLIFAMLHIIGGFWVAIVLTIFVSSYFLVFFQFENFFNFVF